MSVSETFHIQQTNIQHLAGFQECQYHIYLVPRNVGERGSLLEVLRVLIIGAEQLIVHIVVHVLHLRIGRRLQLIK